MGFPCDDSSSEIPVSTSQQKPPNLPQLRLIALGALEAGEHLEVARTAAGVQPLGLLDGTSYQTLWRGVFAHAVTSL